MIDLNNIHGFSILRYNLLIIFQKNCKCLWLAYLRHGCWLWNGKINILMFNHVHGVLFYMSNVFLWFYVIYHVCGRQIWAFSLTYIFCWDLHVSFIDGDHAITLEIFSKERYFNLQLHSCGEGLPMSTIEFILWHRLFLLQWWILFLLWIVKVDNWQIHMKWVIEYNINSIEHFTFVVNGEFKYGLIKVKYTQQQVVFCLSHNLHL